MQAALQFPNCPKILRKKDLDEALIDLLLTTRCNLRA